MPSTPPSSPLESLYEHGRARWPGLEVELADFRAFVSPRLGPGLKADGADLYLACACAGKALARALPSFSRTYDPLLEHVFARLRFPPHVAEELRQELFQLLFVGAPGSPPKIQTFRGASTLGAWVKTVAVRLGLRRTRGAGRADEDATLESLPAVSQDPELLHLKDRCQGEFKSAFRQALATLSARERNLLRQHFLHQLTLEQLAGLHQVHRATAVRWLSAAREKLAGQTRRELVRRLALSPSEVSGVLRLVLSQLEMTFRALEE